MIKLIATMLFVCVMVGSLGCAVALDWGQDACDAVLGGSKAAELCAQLDNLREETEEAAPVE